MTSIAHPTPTPPTLHASGTHLDYSRETEVDGCHYKITVTSTPDLPGFVTVELVGMGPHGEATDGSFTIHSSALPHVGRLISGTFTGLATLHNPVAPPRRRRERHRRPDRPTNSHQPWTTHLESQLSQAWHAADPARPPARIIADMARVFGVSVSEVHRQFPQPDEVLSVEAVVTAIAALMHRTPVAITSRLEKLNLLPERTSVSDGPGRHDAPSCAAAAAGDGDAPVGPHRR